MRPILISTARRDFGDASATAFIGPLASCGESGMWNASASVSIFVRAVIPPVHVTFGITQSVSYDSAHHLRLWVRFVRLYPLSCSL